jgi:cell division protein FtsN
MAQDFAKRKQGTDTGRGAAHKTQARRSTGENPSSGKGFRLYLAGVLTGVFLSFIGYLGTLPDPAEPGQEIAITPKAEVPKPRFEFYTMLTEDNLDVEEKEVVEPAADVSKPPAATESPEPYMLQAGSFRQKDDAERRRAELLLLGLEPKIEETSSDNGRWFRVFLGPFESQESMSRARGLTANQDIDTLVLKRSGP